MPLKIGNGYAHHARWRLFAPAILQTPRIGQAVGQINNLPPAPGPDLCHQAPIACPATLVRGRIGCLVDRTYAKLPVATKPACIDRTHLDQALAQFNGGLAHHQVGLVASPFEHRRKISLETHLRTWTSYIRGEFAGATTRTLMML